MKKYRVAYKRRAQKFIEKNLEGCENPRLHGHALEGELRNFWRYRVGDYRLIAEIFDEEILILVANVDKRDSVYN